jgi:hypothetical protein
MVTEPIPTESSSTERARKKLAELRDRLRCDIVAATLWDNSSEDDRSRLESTDEQRRRAHLDKQQVTKGEEQYRSILGNPVQMWMELRGVSRIRAMLDVGRVTNLITEADFRWLVAVTEGRTRSSDELLDDAIASGDLVLRESPKAVYWKAEEVGVDWDNYLAEWIVVWRLARSAKAGAQLTVSEIGDSLNDKYLSQIRSRMTNRPEFPVELADAIKTVDGGELRLCLPRESIRIFETIVDSTFREWLP